MIPEMSMLIFTGLGSWFWYLIDSLLVMHIMSTRTTTVTQFQHSRHHLCCEVHIIYTPSKISEGVLLVSISCQWPKKTWPLVGWSLQAHTHIHTHKDTLSARQLTKTARRTDAPLKGATVLCAINNLRCKVYTPTRHSNFYHWQGAFKS